jgi:hypothetical protein
MQVNRTFVVSLVLLIFINGAVEAQPDIDAKVERLEHTIRVLERRLEALEEQLRQRNALPAAVTDKAGWRKLQRGMSESDVEKLLGSPTRVDAMGVYTFWHYGPRGGRVTFEGSSRTLYAWSEP